MLRSELITPHGSPERHYGALDFAAVGIRRPEAIIPWARREINPKAARLLGERGCPGPMSTGVSYAVVTGDRSRAVPVPRVKRLDELARTDAMSESGQVTIATRNWNGAARNLTVRVTAAGNLGLLHQPTGLDAGQTMDVGARAHAAISAAGFKWPSGEIRVDSSDRLDTRCEAALVVGILRATGQIDAGDSREVWGSVRTDGRIGDELR